MQSYTNKVQTRILSKKRSFEQSSGLIDLSNEENSIKKLRVLEENIPSSITNTNLNPNTDLVVSIVPTTTISLTSPSASIADLFAKEINLFLMSYDIPELKTNPQTYNNITQNIIMAKKVLINRFNSNLNKDIEQLVKYVSRQEKILETKFDKIFNFKLDIIQSISKDKINLQTYKNILNTNQIMVQNKISSGTGSITDNKILEIISIKLSILKDLESYLVFRPSLVDSLNFINYSTLIQLIDLIAIEYKKSRFVLLDVLRKMEKSFSILHYLDINDYLRDSNATGLSVSINLNYNFLIENRII